MEEQTAEEAHIDITFDVEQAIYNALTETIGAAISWQMKKSGDPLISKEAILEAAINNNLDHLEETCFCTQGADGKVYACGDWLIRPVRFQDQMIPMMDYIIQFFKKNHLSLDNLIFKPGISGSDMRQKIWKETNPDNSSYDIPKSGKDSFGQKRQVSKDNPFGSFGPPPGMGFGPPPGTMGAGGPPPG
ncbi:MAG: hypothetical protein K6G80_02455, partial [Treponema sp.]|nr:hypothetical protein [Treponema sp.]